MSPSPTRYRGSWKIHKRLSEPDRWLEEMGFFRKHTAKDASCLFRAISENIYKTQHFYHKVRLDCVQFMASNKHIFEGSLTCPFENYLAEMSNPSEFGGIIELTAMSHLYRHDFVIFDANKGPQTKISNGYGKTIYLFYSPDTKHFDVVYTKEFVNISSFCQSIMYEILYDGVYQIKDLAYAVDKMLHEKVPTNHIEYYMAENVERRKKQRETCKIFIEASNDDKDKNNNTVALKCKHYMVDMDRASVLKESLSIFVLNHNLLQLDNVCMNCLNVNSAKDLLDNDIIPFPYKVAKALDPNIYRNIEFDVWSELRRELRYSARYSDGTTLQVGVKCLCKLQPDQSVPYHCHIQEMRPDGGPCLVFIEELGEKRIVKYEQLELLPLDEVRPWAPPYRQSRAHCQFLILSQMLKYIGNVSRKQGMIKRSKSNGHESKSSEMNQKSPQNLTWNKKIELTETPQYTDQNASFSTYEHVDFFNILPMPVEIKALPQMVDCRPSSGAPPQEAPLAPTNGSAPPDMQNQPVATDDVAGPGVTSASTRASTPATTTNTMTPYAGNMNPVPVPNAGNVYGAGASVGCAPYMYGVKQVVWCPPPPPPMPPHGVNAHVFKSVQANGADLPMNDIPTLRYYFNLGVDCMWSLYGAPLQPPRHYSPRDITQEMQQMSVHDRGGMNHGEHNKHKPSQPIDKNNANQKGNGQRPMVGPRFKRDGNQNPNQNKGYNNTGQKGPNNRRNSHDGRAGGNYIPEGPVMPGNAGECVMEPPVLTLPYMPYPPPMYPVPYYQPVENDPAMMGAVGGMGYVNYEEGVEYGAPIQHYYPPPHYPPPPLQHPQHHMEHK